MANATNSTNPGKSTQNAVDSMSNMMFNTYGEMVNSFFAAQKKMMETFVGFSTKNMGIENPAFESFRNGTSKMFHTGVDAMTRTVTETTSIANDQVRFAGRVGERMVDSVCGPNMAKSPEAFTATMKTIVNDCVENASAFTNEMMKVASKQMETAQEIFGGMACMAGSYCKAGENAGK